MRGQRLTDSADDVAYRLPIAAGTCDWEAKRWGHGGTIKGGLSDIKEEEYKTENEKGNYTIMSI